MQELHVYLNNNDGLTRLGDEMAYGMIKLFSKDKNECNIIKEQL